MTAAPGSFHSQMKVFIDTGAILLSLHSSSPTIDTITHYLPLTVITYDIFSGQKPQADIGFCWKSNFLGNQWFCFKRSSQYG